LPYRPALHIEFQLGKGKLLRKVKLHGFTAVASSSALAKPTEAASAAKAGEKFMIFTLHFHLKLV